MMLKRTLIVAAFVAAILLFGGNVLRRVDSVQQVLGVNDADLDFGHVWLCDRLHHRLRIHNRSRHEIEISAFDISCACTNIVPGALFIAPGGTESVELTVDLSRISKEEPSASVWPISVTVQPIAGNDPMPAWRLRGIIRSPLVDLPRPGAEVVTLQRLDAPRAMAFDVRLKEGFQLKRATADNSGVSCNLLPQRPGVEVLVDPKAAPTGLSHVRCWLHIVDPRANALPPIPFATNVIVKASVVADPQAVLLADDRSARTVILRSRNTRRFRIIDIEGCEGVTAEASDASTEYRETHYLTVIGNEFDDAMSVAELCIVVNCEGANLRERIIIPIQRPSQMMASSVVSRQ